MSRAIPEVKNADGKVELKEILADERKKVRLYLLLAGILLVVVGLSFSKPTQNYSVQNKENIASASGELSSFLSEPVSIDKALLNGAQINKTKNPPIRLVISSAGIDIPVKEAKVINGYWEVFPDSAGFGLGSAYPEDSGNQVIFAHAREGLFLPLKKVKIGDNITVFTKDKWYLYRVEAIKDVLPSQTEVIAPTADPVLTLYTCTGFSDSKRLIVTAKRV